jgi:hypothetical protein
LEAALFFSLPCWLLTLDRAWPGGIPWQFTFAVLTGATGALVICHILPALCAPTVEWLWSTRTGRAILLPLGVWLAVGAAAALFETAMLVGSMVVLWQDLSLDETY